MSGSCRGRYRSRHDLPADAGCAARPSNAPAAIECLGEGGTAAVRAVRGGRNVTATDIPRVALGASGIEVSRLALGSWRTFERIGREQGIRVMRAARDAGITFLDDARYNDETGRAPIPTGYSEVVFGEL